MWTFPRLSLWSGLVVAGLMALPFPADAATNGELAQLRQSFAKRRDTRIARRAGEPLKIAEKRDPLGPNRPAYTRHYSYSIIGFAMKAMWLNEQLDRANAALGNALAYESPP